MAGGEISPASRGRMLSSLGADDIFEVIKNAIAVAVHDHPHELVKRLVLQMLHAATASAAAAADMSTPGNKKIDDGSKNQPVGDENCLAGSGEALPVSEQVARMNRQLVGEEDGRPCSDEAVLQSLRALQAIPMTLETLDATKIGRTVRGLRKHASEQVRELAGDLYKSWKAVVEEHIASHRTPTESTITAAAVVHKPSGSNQEASPASRETPKAVERVGGSLPVTSAASATKANARKPEQQPPPPKPSCPSASKRKAETSMDEARLKTATRRLREGYQEATTIKKQRLIKLIATPSKARQCPVIVERQRDGAGKRAPAPPSRRMHGAL